MIAYGPGTLAACAAIVFVAYFVRGMSGFGTALVAIPMMVYLIPLHTAVPMMGLLAAVAMAYLGVRDRTDVVWDEFRRLIVPTILGVVIGVWIFSRLEADFLLKLLGGFIVAYAIYMVAAEFIHASPQRCSTRWAWPAGFAAAVVDAVFGGGGGLLAVIYMHRRGYEKAAFRATLAMLWIGEMVVRVGSYAVGGYYDTPTLVLAALMLPLMYFGNRAGERVTNRMSPQAFSRLIAVMLGASGTSLLLK